jgi:hypothetical protein
MGERAGGDIFGKGCGIGGWWIGRLGGCVKVELGFVKGRGCFK